VSVPFDFDEVFEADYLFFCTPLLADVTESDVIALGKRVPWPRKAGLSREYSHAVPLMIMDCI